MLGGGIGVWCGGRPRSLTLCVSEALELSLEPREGEGGKVGGETEYLTVKKAWI